ncbi:sensor histidine kinase [Bacteroidota bacterium]
MKKLPAVIIHSFIVFILLILPLSLVFIGTIGVPEELRIRNILFVSFPIVFFYSTYFFLSEKLINKRNWLKIFLIFITVGILTFAVKLAVFYYVFTKFDMVTIKNAFFSVLGLSGDFVNNLLIMSFAVFVQISKNWFVVQKLKSELILQQKKQELALLKSQLNPHFFFNTINNIYSLVYKKSDKAPAALLKLSELMRYMLYESKGETVVLSKEIQYMEDYIDLLKLRVKDQSYISYKLEGNINNILVPPMLLISFVENAFKHGKKQVANPGIIIKIGISDMKLRFEISNYTLDDNKTTDKGGIGLQNVKRILEILYPDSHKLQISHTDEMYKVLLEVDFNK